MWPVRTLFNNQLRLCLQNYVARRPFRDSYREHLPVGSNLPDTQQSPPTFHRHLIPDAEPGEAIFSNCLPDNASRESLNKPPKSTMSRVSRLENISEKRDGRLLDIILQPEVEGKAIEIISSHLKLDQRESQFYFRYLFFNVKRTMQLGGNKIEEFLIDLNETMNVLKSVFTCEQIRSNNSFILYGSDLLRFRINLLRSFQIDPIRPVHVLRFETMFNLNERLLKKFAAIPSNFDGLQSLLSLIPNMTDEEKQRYIATQLPKPSEQLSLIELHRMVLKRFVQHPFEVNDSSRSQVKAYQTLVSTVAVNRYFEQYQLFSWQQLSSKHSALVLSIEHTDLIRFLHNRPVISGHSTRELIFYHPRTILNDHVYRQLHDFFTDLLQLESRHLIQHFSLFSVRPETIFANFRFWCDVFSFERLRDRNLATIHLLANQHLAKKTLKQLLRSTQTKTINDHDTADLFERLLVQTKFERIRKPSNYRRFYDPTAIVQLADLLQTTPIDVERLFEQLNCKECCVTIETCRMVGVLLNTGYTRQQILDNIEMLLYPRDSSIALRMQSVLST